MKTFKSLILSATIQVSSAKIGEMDPMTGFYDGMIGFVQRNETNTFIQTVRTDSTPNKPGIFVPFPGMHDSPKIYSQKPKVETFIFSDVLYLWTNFTIETWYYFLISFITSSLLFLFFRILLGEKIDKVSKMITSCFNYYWNYFMLFVGHSPTTIDSYQSSNILWTFITLAIFYGIHTILMGTLSTDFVVLKTNQSIETLYNFLNEEQFQNITPIIIRNLNMYSVLRNSLPGTNEGKLFQMLSNNQSGEIVVCDLTTTNPEALQKALNILFSILNNVVEGKSILIENSFYFDIGSPFLCALKPEIVSRIKASKEIILPSSLSFLVSKSTPIEAVKLFKHRMTSYAEMGARIAIGKLMPYEASDLDLIPSVSIKSLICSETIENILWFDGLNLDWAPVKIDSFHRFLLMCFILVIIALIVLIIEHLWKHSTNFWQPKNRIITRRGNKVSQVRISAQVFLMNIRSKSA